jgi:hypothetical protein
MEVIDSLEPKKIEKYLSFAMIFNEKGHLILFFIFKIILKIFISEEKMKKVNKMTEKTYALCENLSPVLPYKAAILHMSA